jgi:hypothetical protein
MVPDFSFYSLSLFCSRRKRLRLDLPSSSKLYMVTSPSTVMPFKLYKRADGLG